MFKSGRSLQRPIKFQPYVLMGKCKTTRSINTELCTLGRHIPEYLACALLTDPTLRAPGAGPTKPLFFPIEFYWRNANVCHSYSFGVKLTKLGSLSHGVNAQFVRFWRP